MTGAKQGRGFFIGRVPLCLALLFLFCLIPPAYSNPYPERDAVLALIDRSISKLRIGEYELVRQELGQAMEKASASGDEVLIARVYNQLGVLNIYEFQFPEALTNLQNALTLFKNNNDNNGVAESLNNMASIHFNLKNYQQAKENYRQSMKLREAGGDWTNLGVSYNNLGLVYNRLNELDSALYYHHQSLGIWELLGDHSGIGVTLNHIATVMKHQGELTGALDVLKESYQYLISDPGSLLGTKEMVRSEIGLILSMLGQYEEVIEWCRDLCWSSEEAKVKASSQSCCNALHQAYLGLEDFENALEAHVKYVQLGEEIFGSRAIQEVTRLELNYAFEQIHKSDSLRFESERQLQQERINRQRLGLTAALGFLFFVSLLVVVISKGKRRSDELLLNILPATVAKELKATGKSAPRKYDLVTVIFADIKGFTNIAEGMTPEELIEEINVIFTDFDRIMEKYGIEKIKTIGDCYMAVCGLPDELDDHALRSVQAAIAMQQVMSAINAKKKVEGKEFLEIRIGLHSGPVVAGIVGTKKFQYDIWGDTVNTANRLETTCQPGKINISDSTYQIVKDHFNCSYRGEIETKGKGKVSMYYVEESL
ncbi:MAG: hypothetical protein EA409_02840 [Saprospirales bacterium]|nr:MAG: hypothetical protein EA409_02840 [Saprospirales bacterium]